MPAPSVVRWGVTLGAILLIALVYVPGVLLVDRYGGFAHVERRYGVGRNAALIAGFVCTVGFVVPVVNGVGTVASTPLALAAAAAVVAGAVLLGRGLTNLGRYLDLRRAAGPDLVDAAAGRVAVSGTVRPTGDPLVSPLSGESAVAWSVRVLESTRVSGGGRGLDVVVDDHRERPFVIEDGTGRLRVEPSAGTPRLERDLRAEVRSDDGVPEPVRRLLAERDAAAPDGRRIYYESRLEPGETATVLGEAIRYDGRLVVRDDSLVVEEGDLSATCATYRRYVPVGGLAGLALSMFGVAGLVATL